MFTFGSRSRKNLETAHRDLQVIFNEAIRRSKVDFGVTEGHRSVSRQYELYRQGKSRIDGRTRKGKHNYKPSLAVDIYTYHPDLSTRRRIAYDTNHLAYIAGVVDAVVEDLLKERKISHKIRWGGNWDSDGVIAYDQSFDDLPHFELISI